MIYAAQASKEDLRRNETKCWSPDCKNRAWLEDCYGWHWCFRHWWRSYYWGGGEVSLRSFIWNLKHTKIK